MYTCAAEVVLVGPLLCVCVCTLRKDFLFQLVSGRGTSAGDGLALAESVLEHLSTVVGIYTALREHIHFGQNNQHTLTVVQGHQQHMSSHCRYM